MKRICAKCKVEKDISEFYPSKKYIARYYCKDCSKEIGRTARLANIEKPYYNIKIPKDNKREYHLKKTFGISQEDFLILKAKQKNKCAICGRDEVEFKKQFSIDHDHVTGKIRGLLCTNCNTGLGQFNDAIFLLEKALKYLKAHEIDDKI